MRLKKTTVKHVGVTLSSDLSCIERTVQACRTMRSLTMALFRSGAHVVALNPVTSAQLIKTIIYTKALYGRELWILSKPELLLLERAQRFIAKSIQGLERRTRTDMCNGLLGWASIEGYIDMKKLLYIGNICRQDNQLLPRRIIVTRLLMFNANGQNQIGLKPEFMRILNKYKLTQHISNFVDTGEFVCKATWQLMVKNTIHSYEEREWLQRKNGICYRLCSFC